MDSIPAVVRPHRAPTAPRACSARRRQQKCHPQPQRQRRAHPTPQPLPCRCSPTATPGCRVLPSAPPLRLRPSPPSFLLPLPVSAAAPSAVLLARRRESYSATRDAATSCCWCMPAALLPSPRRPSATLLPRRQSLTLPGSWILTGGRVPTRAHTRPCSPAPF